MTPERLERIRALDAILSRTFGASSPLVLEWRAILRDLGISVKIKG